MELEKKEIIEMLHKHFIGKLTGDGKYTITGIENIVHLESDNGWSIKLTVKSR